MATVNYDYSFTPNTAAKATEVNGNFNKIKEFAEGISTGTNLDANAVSTVKILNGAVNTDKLGADAVTEVKIANNAVTAAKIASNAVTNSKLDYTTVPQTTVSTSGPTGGKDGDIWVQVV